MSKPRRSRIRLLAAERSEPQRIVAARTSIRQAAYRAEIADSGRPGDRAGTHYGVHVAMTTWPTES